MTIESMPKFSGAAAKLWKDIPEKFRKLLLSNVWCGHCSKESTITNFSGSVKSGTLILEGECATCHGKVARVVD